MNDHFVSSILRETSAKSIKSSKVIQELWSGYGKILRIELVGSSHSSVVVKHVQLPLHQNHPRGWNTDIGHDRKVKSYQVETKWYEKYSKRSVARLPHCLDIETHHDEVLMILEDLNTQGFSLRKNRVTWEELRSCLKWLAQFHVSYLGDDPEGLWEVGTYWHLETRPQELERLDDQKLKEAASMIDHTLKACKYKTIVHGDAKLANFCFSEDGEVSGLDFQYVGGGCGMKDLAYLVGSCLGEHDCELMEDQILDSYFQFLQNELEEENPALEKEWRSLYRVAWADFHRFLKGWSPGHWKINSYSERVVAEVLKDLK